MANLPESVDLRRSAPASMARLTHDRPACDSGRHALPARRARLGLRLTTSRMAWAVVLGIAWPLSPAAWAAADTTPAQQVQAWSLQAGVAPDAARGKAFFTAKHGGDWSCASCHGEVPTQAGKHASTGKLIEPLAPAVNPKSLTQAARTEKWFRRNCNDVLKRACSAAEKADVLAYLLSVQP